MSVPGGYTESKPATPEIQKIVEQVKPQLEEKENKTYKVFKAVEFRRQVVARTNNLIKLFRALEGKQGPDTGLLRHLACWALQPGKQPWKKGWNGTCHQPRK
ncbi:cystatin-A-like isoform X2 [Pelodiscus sinensis]|uniref:cystatin-A-like isoform X2 n=1 Tax=Pelodiscus sinensis TaxID=13735 RepID=UPI003F6AEEB9